MASRGIGKGRSGGTVVALVALLFVALLLSALSATSETTPVKESSRDLRAPGPIKCRGSDYDFIAPSNCAPAFSVNLKQCTSRMRKCKCQYNVDLKWTGKGCPNTRGEGGCQCIQYCGYTCKGACVKDKRCEFVDNQCRNRVSGVGGPMSTCPTASPSVSPSLATNSPSASPSSCFPGESLVISQSRGEVRIDELKVGEYIQDIDEKGKITFVEVLMFMHKVSDVSLEYVEIELDMNKTIIHASTTHFLFVLDDMLQRKAIWAEHVKVGDRMILAEPRTKQSRMSPVAAVRRTIKKGQYSILTMTSSLVVQNVLASSHSDVDPAMGFIANAPVRWWAKYVGNVPEYYDAQGLHVWSSFLLQIARFVPASWWDSRVM